MIQPSSLLLSLINPFDDQNYMLERLQYYLEHLLASFHISLTLRGVFLEFLLWLQNKKISFTRSECPFCINVHAFSLGTTPFDWKLTWNRHCHAQLRFSLIKKLLFLINLLHLLTKPVANSPKISVIDPVSTPPCNIWSRFLLPVVIRTISARRACKVVAVTNPALLPRTFCVASLINLSTFISEKPERINFCQVFNWG